MKRDAEAHAAEDEAKSRLVEVRNQAEMLVYSTQKTLSEHGDKVSAEDRSTIESAISNLQDKLKGDDQSAIEAASRELETAAQALAKAAYEAASKEGARPEAEVKPDAAEGKDADEVIDAEYEVKD